MSTKLDQIKKAYSRLSSQASSGSALLAVSGGVDSIVLLHLLASLNSNLEAAYIDHSQRSDTNLDIVAIQKITDQFNIKLHITKLDLPKDCSEQLARTKRYQALEEIQEQRGLNHIITAHHADDVLETAVINLTRGTGPRGLSSLRHQPNGIWRPFLLNLEDGAYVTKQDVLDYANKHNLEWNEDSTNNSNDYLRNRIRKKLRTSDSNKKQMLLAIISKNIALTDQIDLEIGKLDSYLQQESGTNYSTELFRTLPEEVKDQFLHKKISENGFDVTRDAVNRAKDFIQTKEAGKILQLKGCRVTILKNGLFAFHRLSKEKAD